MAVKIMVTNSLDRSVLREVLLGPHMAHHNVVRGWEEGGACNAASPSH